MSIDSIKCFTGIEYTVTYNFLLFKYRVLYYEAELVHKCISCGKVESTETKFIRADKHIRALFTLPKYQKTNG